MKAETTTDDAAEKLQEYFERHTNELFRTLCFYVYKSFPGQSRDQVAETATEILSEVFIEAMNHADRYQDKSRSPKMWLLGIGANLIKRRRSQDAKFKKWEVEADAAEDFFDSFVGAVEPDAEEVLDLRYQLEAALPKLSNAEQEVVRAAMRYGLKPEYIAKELGIKPGAVRMRLHRAIDRLRLILDRS